MRVPARLGMLATVALLSACGSDSPPVALVSGGFAALQHENDVLAGLIPDHWLPPDAQPGPPRTLTGPGAIKACRTIVFHSAALAAAHLAADADGSIDVELSMAKDRADAYDPAQVAGVLAALPGYQDPSRC